ncbi:cation:proton antiporter [Desulfovibrio inopinatus]|uniref:cation:proton antiporter n=1 Tax=Desulfovibrio inopinatus TaxID=102109 RepID=UPI00041C676B|nr:cation:proton antiporter [Desulfovibrio inopinatus]
MELPLLQDLFVVFGLAIGVIYVCHRIRIPPIVGFLLTGVLTGPHGLRLVHNPHEVELMSEIGVIMLLFTIGLELSVSELARLKRPVFIGGGAQVLLTIIAFFSIGEILDLTSNQAVFLGFLAALSSTAIVLKLLQELYRIDAPHGRVTLSILIFQDVIIVPMMLLVPILAGRSTNLGMSLLLLSGKFVLVLVLVFFLARRLIPWILQQVASVKSRELFLLATLGICLGIALMTSSLGLSLSLGAFLAGLVISESPYSLSALEGILPFRDVFTSLFFVSIGMLLNTAFFWEHSMTIFGIAISILFVKFLFAGAGAIILGYPLRTGLYVGLALCQVGEFSFVLAKAGLDVGLIKEPFYQSFLAASVLTMVLAPFIIKGSPALVKPVMRLRNRLFPDAGVDTEDVPVQPEFKDHLIIVGYGVGGRHLAQTAKASHIPYVIVELNPETVKTVSKQGENILLGDAVHEAVLDHVCIRSAKVLALVIPDPAAVRRITDLARRMSPGLHIIARTRFLAEIEPLLEIGANDVVPEEFETSIEILCRVLSTYRVPRKEIASLTQAIRASGYRSLRKDGEDMQVIIDATRHLPDVDVNVFRVEHGACLEGKSLESAALRREHGVTVVAVSRGSITTANPHAEFRLEEGDRVSVLGTRASLIAVAELFSHEGNEALEGEDEFL